MRAKGSNKKGYNKLFFSLHDNISGTGNRIEINQEAF